MDDGQKLKCLHLICWRQLKDENLLYDVFFSVLCFIPSVTLTERTFLAPDSKSTLRFFSQSLIPFATSDSCCQARPI